MLAEVSVVFENVLDVDEDSKYNEHSDERKSMQLVPQQKQNY